ncbi:MAG: 50S ribosomal protein L11 methyltransferase [Ignavibacteria bacterium]|nr:50S ribosomal protein L11 methyltransferase [Ignavibacteria bacterium]
MRKLLVNIFSGIYSKFKSNKFLSGLYYSVANKNYFTSFLEQEKMIGDKVRMDAYHKGITKGVKKGDVVIDLGTGTGILSFFAAKSSPKKIYAIDHSEIINSAKKIALHNNISNIEFVNINSREFKIDEKADVIIHEQIGAFLFDENMTENITDLRDRLLKKDGKIIPGKFEVCLVPVRLKEYYRVPFISEQEIYGIKFNCFDELKNNADPGYGILYVRPEAVQTFLSEPETILKFDLETMNVQDIPLNFNFKKIITESGVCDGICFYFKIIFDKDLILDTNPLTTVTHWNIPILRTYHKEFQTGDEININFEWGNPSDISTYKWGREL